MYRPPGKNKSFLADFGDFLSSIIRLERILLLGDFNIHVNKSADSFAMDFLNLMDSFNFIQHVSSPTPEKGNTLDLVFTIGLNVSDVCIEDWMLSDHKGVMFRLSLDKDLSPEKRMKCSRTINNIAVENFRASFSGNVLMSPDDDVDVLVCDLNAHCAAILDDVAPLVTRSARVTNPSPWLNEEIYTLRRKRCRVERAWKASKREVHRLYLKDLMAEYNTLVEMARAAYFANLITSSLNNPMVLFSTINTIIAPPLPSVPLFSDDDCNAFLMFFVNKVAEVRANITPSLSPPGAQSSFFTISE